MIKKGKETKGYSTTILGHIMFWQPHYSTMTKVWSSHKEKMTSNVGFLFTIVKTFDYINYGRKQDKQERE
jgi:hypothetical protein